MNDTMTSQNIDLSSWDTLYLPPGVRIAPADMTNLISHLPPPFIFLDNLKARNIICGSVLTDERQRTVSNACDGFDYSF
jgi:hypothetical protein